MTARVALLDVNVLVALFDPSHVHHTAAHDWFADRGEEGWATCPITENGLLRIVGHPKYPNSPGPPSPEASRLDALRRLWQEAGLVDLETETIEVRRDFESFDRHWEIAHSGPRVSARIAELSEADRSRLREALRRRLPPDASGKVVCSARAHAIKGRVPGR